MKVKVIDKMNVYGCSHPGFEDFRTTDYNLARAMESVMNPGWRKTVEADLVASGRFVEGSKRIKGHVDKLLEYGVKQEKCRLDGNPDDHFGIGKPA